MEVAGTAINAAVVAAAGLLLGWFGRGRFEAQDRRFDRLEERLDRQIEGLGDRLDREIGGLGNRLDRRIDGLEGRWGGGAYPPAWRSR